MRVVALTGSVGAGKSTVAALLAEWGATIIDADQLVRELQQPGQLVLEKMVVAFGREILHDDGTLDRDAMRQIMLADATARGRLERIIHPAVEERRIALVAAARAAGARLVIVDIPLLFESADASAYDGVIVVDAPVGERRRRLIELRHLGADEVDRLMAAQLPPAIKRRRANWVIDNDGDLALLRQRARDVWLALPR